MQKEWVWHSQGPAPSVRTMQRVLQRYHLTTQLPKPYRQGYRLPPDATSPDAVHVTDIITRWITDSEVVQTFHTVDVYSHDAYATSHTSETAMVACEHLQTRQLLSRLRLRHENTGLCSPT